MKCPCKTCEKQGCGTAHDTCANYQEWLQVRALANARKYSQADVEGAIVAARLRLRRRKK